MSVILTQPIFYNAALVPVDGATLDYPAAFEADLVTTNRAVYAENPSQGGLVPVEATLAANGESVESLSANGLPIDLGGATAPINILTAALPNGVLGGYGVNDILRVTDKTHQPLYRWNGSNAWLAMLEKKADGTYWADGAQVTLGGGSAPIDILTAALPNGVLGGYGVNDILRVTDKTHRPLYRWNGSNAWLAMLEKKADGTYWADGVQVSLGGGATAPINILTADLPNGVLGGYSANDLLRVTDKTHQPLYRWNGSNAWLPMLEQKADGTVWAGGSPLEATYTQTQLNALLAGRGNVISRVSRPILKPSSASVTNSTGLITLNTALNSNNTWYIPGGGIPAKIWLPANYVTGIAVAQLHDCTILSATQVQLTGNPATATSYVSDNNATAIPLHTFTLTGGLFGSNGQLDFETGTSHSGTLTNTHLVEIFTGATSVGGQSNYNGSTGDPWKSRFSKVRMRGRGFNNLSKVAHWPTASNNNSSYVAAYALQYLEANTAVDTTWDVTVKCPNTDNIIIDSFTATLWLGS
jgi:hypothetical protein